MTNPLFCIVWRLIRISTGLFLTKTAPNLTETKRHELLGMLKAGMTVQEVQKQTGVSRPTLHRILERFEETGGSLEAKKKTGRPRTKTTRESNNSLDFSIWAKYAAAVEDTRPKNRQDLVNRLERSLPEVPDQEYVPKVCQAAWDRLRRIVAAKGTCLTPKNVDVESSDDEDGD